MYQRFLLAVDGSELSDKAFNHGLALAKALGVPITVVHVTPPWTTVAVGEVAVMFPPEEYEANMKAAAQQLLGRMSKAAEAAGVTCDTVQVSDPQPHKAILEAAQHRGCDLIVMGSHGRHGIAGLLLGSVTIKTLTHGKVPVLVYRE
jgi:nucleotide-binding universal stress UspA family protein